MKESYDAIRTCILEDWRQALKEVLSMMGVGLIALFVFTVILYAYNLPEPAPGIQSAEHRAVVKAHLVRSR